MLNDVKKSKKLIKEPNKDSKNLQKLLKLPKEVEISYRAQIVKNSLAKSGRISTKLT